MTDNWVLTDVNPESVVLDGMVSGVRVGEEAEEGGGVPGAPRPGFGIMDSDELDVGAGGVLEPEEDGVLVGVLVD